MNKAVAGLLGPLQQAATRSGLLQSPAQAASCVLISNLTSGVQALHTGPADAQDGSCSSVVGIMDSRCSRVGSRGQQLGALAPRREAGSTVCQPSSWIGLDSTTSGNLGLGSHLMGSMPGCSVQQARHLATASSSKDDDDERMHDDDFEEEVVGPQPIARAPRSSAAGPAAGHVAAAASGAAALGLSSSSGGGGSPVFDSLAACVGLQQLLNVLERLGEEELTASVIERALGRLCFLSQEGQRLRLEQPAYEACRDKLSKAFMGLWAGQQGAEASEEAPAGSGVDPVMFVHLLHTFAVIHHCPAEGREGLKAIEAHVAQSILPEIKQNYQGSAQNMHLVDAVWALSHLFHRVSEEVDGRLYEEVANILTPRAAMLPSRHLSKLVQAYAVANYYHYPLVSAACDAAIAKLGDFDPAGLANIVGNLAKLRHENCDALLHAVVASTRRFMSSRTVKGHQVVTITRSLAALKYYDMEYIRQANEYCVRQLAGFSPQQVSSLVWAASRAKYGVEEEGSTDSWYNAMATRMLQVADRAKPSHLAMVVWSFGRVGKLHEALCRRVAEELVTKLDQASIKNMCNALFGLAQLGAVEAAQPLCTAVAEALAVRFQDPEGRLVQREQVVNPRTGQTEEAEVYKDTRGRRVERFPPNEAGLVEELVVYPDGHRQLRAWSMEHGCQWVPQNLSDLAWAYSQLGFVHPQFLDVLVARCSGPEAVERFSRTSLVDLAVALAELSREHPPAYSQQLFTALEQQAVVFMSDFGPRYLADLLYAFACVEHPVGLDFLRGACDVAWAKWPRIEGDDERVAKIAWGLIKLEADVKLEGGHPIFEKLQEVMAASQQQQAEGEQ